MIMIMIMITAAASATFTVALDTKQCYLITRKTMAKMATNTRATPPTQIQSHQGTARATSFTVL